MTTRLTVEQVKLYEKLPVCGTTFGDSITTVIFRRILADWKSQAAEIERLDNENKQLEFRLAVPPQAPCDKCQKLHDEIERLNTIIYSTDTPEWKSAAFQKIKGLEAELEQAKDHFRSSKYDKDCPCLLHVKARKYDELEAKEKNDG